MEREQQDRDREFEQDRAETMGISQGLDDTPVIVGDGSTTHHAPKFVDGGKVRDLKMVDFNPFLSYSVPMLSYRILIVDGGKMRHEVDFLNVPGLSTQHIHLLTYSNLI